MSENAMHGDEIPSKRDLLNIGGKLLDDMINQNVAEQWATAIREMLMHAKEGCMRCQQILRGLGVNPDLSYEENVRIAQTMFPNV